jgi:uncharacterized protein (DUF1684 family)
VVRTIGADYYLLAQDADNPAARNFTGTEWFPVDHAYRVRGEFVAYAQPQSVTVPMTHIESRTVMSSTGDVIFRLKGARLRLKSCRRRSAIHHVPPPHPWARNLRRLSPQRIASA